MDVFHTDLGKQNLNLKTSFLQLWNLLITSFKIALSPFLPVNLGFDLDFGGFLKYPETPAFKFPFEWGTNSHAGDSGAWHDFLASG